MTGASSDSGVPMSATNNDSPIVPRPRRSHAWRRLGGVAGVVAGKAWGALLGLDRYKMPQHRRTVAGSRLTA